MKKLEIIVPEHLMELKIQISRTDLLDLKFFLENVSLDCDDGDDDFGTREETNSYNNGSVVFHKIKGALFGEIKKKNL